MLAATCLTAQAEQKWSFTYTGFYDGEAGIALPDQKLSGTFTGSDKNHDGYLELTELSSLRIDGEYEDFIQCSQSVNPYYSCGTSTFTYRLGHGLAFSLGWKATTPPDLGDDVKGRSIFTGYVDYTHNQHEGEYTARHLYWTEGTQQMVIGPVPEPSTYAMLGLGLLGLALRARRRSS